MSVRLEEIHPMLVHYPLALLPTAVGADLLARATGSERLADVGRTLMPFAAASAAVAAVAGIVAQEEVQADAEAQTLLVTHRNLNLSLVSMATALAAWRWRQKQAGTGYLALALAGLGVMGYSAYLGGKMVYDHGLGVRAADGLADPDAPEITAGNVGAMARRAGRDVERGIGHAIADLRTADPVPAIG